MAAAQYFQGHNKATFTQSNPTSLSYCRNVDQNIDHACFFSVVDKLSGDR